MSVILIFMDLVDLSINVLDFLLRLGVIWILEIKYKWIEV